MPIVGEGNDVWVEYNMPEEIKVMVTKEFLTEFRNQIFRIEKGIGLNTFLEDGMWNIEGTSGWDTAFGIACLNTKNEKLLNYYDSLPWYDSDLFDGIITDMMVENHLILGTMSDFIKEKLELNEDEYAFCGTCGNWYPKELLDKTDEDDESYYMYICKSCKDHKPEQTNSSEYYRTGLKQVRNYREEKK